MKIIVRSFWAPKQGNSDDEYEDAFCSAEPKGDKRLGRCFHFAVADGATESSYSRLWAERIVKACCQGTGGTPFKHKWLASLQANWFEELLNRLKLNQNPVPWYREAKLQQGAYAAVVYLRIYRKRSKSNKRLWNAIALGDSCLVQMRKEKILKKFPIERSDGFNNRPFLLSSNPAQVSNSLERVQKISGTWAPGDVFYLMTDAFASWFLRAVENGKEPWREFEKFNSDDGNMSFREWVSALRSQGAMRNDDVTLLHVVLKKR
jgi:hypothetical protein